MATAFHHGITVAESKTTSRLIATIATACIGLVVTAPAADATVFPLDKPVLIDETPGHIDMTTALAKIGATGTGAKVLAAIASKVRAPVIVVRVAPGADATATAAAVIGTNVAGVRTGLQALLAAEAQTGIRPRILAAPGLETQAVTEAIAAVGAKLRAMAYARAIGADIAALAAYRAGFTQRELMLLYPDLKVTDATGAVVPSFAAAHAVGMRALIDQTQGWHKTLSNVAIPGVVGTTADVPFDLQDPDADANRLNADEVTTIVRLNGELRFWGSRTCSTDADFYFESATRTAHIVADTIANGLIWAIDKPLTPALAKDIVELCNQKFRAMTQAGEILGATAWFDPTRNPVTDLKAGKLGIRYRYTPVPPLEHLHLSQEVTDEFLADFATLVAA
ncbi:phage tail sheath subtilisin-like domain-containing protein [Sphingomonas panni]|uniref:phage tail sheath subtilisin-like domain-containing protein n=1 Tax=Sphingomonas panni TaxID=237612 RepID=UPI001F5B8036|nr:phage tail sheath subtilisin-like domain-containing protein [Sphingomonas panni]